MKKIFVVIVAVFTLSSITTRAQFRGSDVQGHTGQSLEYNVISTAVPFMIIAPDARSAGMGDCGVATSPDVYSMHWNAAKYAFIKEDFSAGLAYSPWLRNLVPDMNIAYLGLSKRVSPRSTIAASLRFFSLGEVNFTDEQGVSRGTYKPNEWAVDVAYSRKLGEHFSAAVSARFIYSNLTQGVTDGAKPAISVAADLGVYYQKQVDWFNNMDAEFSWGVSITNIGSKMNYNQNTIKKDFIPTNLRFGPSLNMRFDEYNSLAVTFDLNKLLVPTPPIYLKNSAGTGDSLDPSGNRIIYKGMNDDVSLVQGMIQSFYDAPDGFSEELKEFTIGLGAEYWYDKVFSIRAGFFHEAKMKGNRRYVTLGAGLRYNVFGIDVSYLVPVNNTATSGTNPLEGTLRFNLVMNFDAWNKNTNTKLEEVGDDW